MKQIGTYILLVLCVAFAACERIESLDEFDAKQINLFARVGVHLDVEQTRSSSLDEGFDIGIVRIDEKVSTGYPYFKNCEVMTANLDTPAEGNLRLVSGFKKQGVNAPQFFRNSSDEVSYIAWHPWPATQEEGYAFESNAGGTRVTFPIAATGDTDILYSNPVKGKMSTGFEVMQFKHALPLFRIYVYKSNANSWGDLKSVSIDGLPDMCVLTLPSSQQNNTTNITYSYKPSNVGLTLNSVMPAYTQIPVGFENKVCVQKWIAAPAVLGEGNDNLKVLNISLLTNNGEDTKSSVAVAGNFMAGHAYDIILRFSDDGIVNAEVQIGDWHDSEYDINTETVGGNVFYDLSHNGTANCYIVSSANFDYCFDATVKGNGSIEAFPGTRIDPSLNPKFVDIIWCDNAVKDDFSLETNKIVEGKVLFKVKGDTDNDIKTLKGEGNVLLGVYDKEGDGRQCLWTWHIWITDKPQKQNYTKGYIVLDRNLGATAPAPAVGATDPTREMKGLFYQWGRPTPFRVIPSKNDVNVKVIDGTKSDTRVSPDQAVANPMIFYGRLENTDAAPSATNFHDWVDREQFINPKFVDNLWGYREEEHQQPIKTIYDPCPPGYHVPYSRNWANMDRYWSEAEAFTNSTDKNGDWSKLHGIKLFIESNEIWYPFQGYINKDGVYKTGHMHMHDGIAEESDVKVVEVWSSLINRNKLNDLADDEPYRFLFTRDYGSMLSDSHTNRSRGLAVRCVSDNTVDVVKNLSASQTANCYMVHEDGYYKFDATVRGNGVGSLLPLGGTTTAEINGGLSTNISPYKVDLLWWQGDFADYPDMSNSNPEKICLKLLDNGIVGPDGYVAFQISDFKKGNLILAAYDEYNTILWTWHIWMTDKPKDRLSGNYTKMDRFLGATFAPTIGNTTNLGVQPEYDEQIKFENGQLQATFGFYYQWGRKDPIIGPPSTEQVRDASATNTSQSVASAGWWIKGTDGTWTYKTTISTKDAALIPDVVKDPTAFYRSRTERSRTDSQWFPSSFADGYTNVALWGYAVKDYGIQGQTFSKTMHDPCPPGYRTPFHFSWRYDGEYKYAEGDGGEGVTYLIHEPWFEIWQDGVDPNGIVTNKPHFERMWYPFTGYRSPLTGGYEDVGTVGYMYTGMPMGQYNTRSFWYSQSQSGQNADNKGHGSAYGKMIRCMKE